MKQQEKHRKSVLEGISRAQGALPRAAKVVSRISKSRMLIDCSRRLMSRLRLMLSEMMYIHQAANQSESKRRQFREREKADAYADEILARRAQGPR